MEWSGIHHNIGLERRLGVIFGGFRGIDVAICLPNCRQASSINNAVVEIRPCFMFVSKKVCSIVVLLRRRAIVR
jgi:hypothetical protein